MSDRERISNLEEMAAETFIRLDKVEKILKNMPSLEDSKKYALKSLDDGLRELARKELVLNDRQSLLEKSFVLLTEVCRRNSEEIHTIQNTPREKYDNAELFEFLMVKFDKIDERFEQTDKRFKQIDERFNQLEKELHARMNRQEEDLKNIWNEVNSLKNLAYTLKSEIASLKNRLDNNPS